ncbi:MAG: 50S ribosomal protein L10 [Gammaproteobacteria bacterium]
MTLEQKKTVVAEVAEVAGQARSAIAAEYRGLSVAQMTRLRTAAREANVHLRVVPNTLAQRAVEGTDFACMRDSLAGPLVLAFARDEPGSAARVMAAFAKENDKLKVILIAFGGKLIAPGDIDVLAKLPTREEALGTLLAVMKAPITRLARTLAEPYAKLVRTLAAIRDQKQQA